MPIEALLLFVSAGGVGVAVDRWTYRELGRWSSPHVRHRTSDESTPLS
jgi:hypothetical protein